jgi:hypothetical protein
MPHASPVHVTRNDMQLVRRQASDGNANNNRTQVHFRRQQKACSSQISWRQTERSGTPAEAYIRRAYIEAVAQLVEAHALELAGPQKEALCPEFHTSNHRVSMTTLTFASARNHARFHRPRSLMRLHAGTTRERMHLIVTPGLACVIHLAL